VAVATQPARARPRSRGVAELGPAGCRWRLLQDEHARDELTEELAAASERLEETGCAAGELSPVAVAGRAHLAVPQRH